MAILAELYCRQLISDTKFEAIMRRMWGFSVTEQNIPQEAPVKVVSKKF